MAGGTRQAGRQRAAAHVQHMCCVASQLCVPATFGTLLKHPRPACARPRTPEPRLLKFLHQCQGARLTFPFRPGQNTLPQSSTNAIFDSRPCPRRPTLPPYQARVRGPLAPAAIGNNLPAPNPCSRAPTLACLPLIHSVCPALPLKRLSRGFPRLAPATKRMHAPTLPQVQEWFEAFTPVHGWRVLRAG